MPAAVIVAADERRFQQLDLFGFRLSRTGIAPAGRTKPTETQWQQLGDYLAWAEQSTPWLIAEWLAYGEANYGERAAQAASDATGFKLDTIKQYEWVAGKVAPEQRDPDLSFAHHRIVAALRAPSQRRMLALAKENGWSTKKLQMEVNKLKPSEGIDRQLWLVVSCKSQRDRDRLVTRMEEEGRTVKIP